jgi:DNA-binding NarL/FixJ family response regulator
VDSSESIKKINPLRILLIEDSPTDALLLNAKLQQVTEFVFDLEHVTTLADGVSKLEAGPKFDAVILDLSLPDSFGIETYAKVRSHVSEAVPVIIVSGNDDRAMLNDALKQGADNYLVKDTVDGNRIAVAILSSLRNRSNKLDTMQRRVLEDKPEV